MRPGYVITLTIAIVAAAIFSMVATATDLEKLRLFAFVVGVVLVVTASAIMLTVAAGLDRSD